MTEPVTQAEYQVIANFRYALRRFQRFTEEAAQAVGLAPQQYQALLAIRGGSPEGRIVIGELAERLQIRHHTAVELVNRLEGQGLVEREPSRTDRRSVYVRLTPQSVALLEQLTTVHRQELRRLAPELTALLLRLLES